MTKINIQQWFPMATNNNTKGGNVCRFLYNFRMDESYTCCQVIHYYCILCFRKESNLPKMAPPEKLQNTRSAQYNFFCRAQASNKIKVKPNYNPQLSIFSCMCVIMLVWIKLLNEIFVKTAMLAIFSKQFHQFPTN